MKTFEGAVAVVVCGVEVSKLHIAIIVLCVIAVIVGVRISKRRSE